MGMTPPVKKRRRTDDRVMERGESDEDPDEMEELRRSEWTATWREARMMIRSLIISNSSFHITF